MISVVLAIYTMVNEKKCFFKDITKADTLVFRYDTRAISTDKAKDHFDMVYDYEIIGENGKLLKSGVIDGTGDIELLVNAGSF